MFCRVITFTNAHNLEGGLEFVRDTVAPILHQQHGFAGTIASADRANNLFGVLTLWRTEADREASEGGMTKVRQQGHNVIGGQMTVEYFEEVLLEVVGGQPKVGSGLLVTRVTMDPATVDENITYFQQEVLPGIKAQPGLLAVRQMVNRQTGEALVGSTWTDAKALQGGLAFVEDRQRANPDMPVTIVSRSQREVLYVDVP